MVERQFLESAECLPRARGPRALKFAQARAMNRLARVVPPTVMLQRSAESGAAVEMHVIRKRAVVGRAPGCDVRIEHAQISARHLM